MKRRLRRISALQACCRCTACSSSPWLLLDEERAEVPQLAVEAVVTARGAARTTTRRATGRS